MRIQTRYFNYDVGRISICEYSSNIEVDPLMLKYIADQITYPVGIPYRCNEFPKLYKVGGALYSSNTYRGGTVSSLTFRKVTNEEFKEVYQSFIENFKVCLQRLGYREGFDPI